MKAREADLGAIEAHYSRGSTESALWAALVEAGRDPERLQPDDLAGVDEFHIGGRQATVALARSIRPEAGMRVLDIGCGLGGAARYLAREFGCHVTGIDLAEEYCRLANLLAYRLGLDSRVCCRYGDALAMPFKDGSFDLVWMQHAAMNIRDKDALYQEVWRVLKPGGALATYEILAGTGGPVHFPVPWARRPEISFLVTPQQMRQTLEATGFELFLWNDVTERGRAWFRRVEERTGNRGRSPVGIQVLLGADFPAMAANQVRNLEENRIVLIEAVARRSGAETNNQEPARRAEAKEGGKKDE